MVLTVRAGASGPVFVAVADYSEKDTPKSAGFWWHGSPCRRAACAACAAGVKKSWWTADAAKAARLSSAADAAAKAALATHTAAVAASRATAPIAADAAPIEIPVPVGLTYLPYQLAGIQYAASRCGTLIADEMGLGKTIQALGAINADATIKRVLVVCPNTLRLNWSREASKWLVVDRPHVLVDKTHLPSPTGDVFAIVNYEKTSMTAIHAALMAQSWDLLIVDEAHACKTPTAKRTKAVLGAPRRKTTEAVQGLVHRARRQIFLTGTPIMNRPIEIQPLLGAIAPEQFGSFFAFGKRYANAHQNRYGWDFSGSSNLAELQTKLRASVMIRRLKRDVLAELPAKRRQVIVLAPNGAGKAVAAETKAYEAHAGLADIRATADAAHAAGDTQAYEAAVASLQAGTRLAFAEMARVRHDVAVAKVPMVIEHLQDLLAGGVEKVLIFAHHIDVVHALADALAEHGAVRMLGETSVDDRQAAVDRFQADSTCRVLVGGLGVAGVGITLTAAHHVVFAEIDWVPATITQAEDRAHRIGQTEPVLIQHLVLDGSIDSRMASMIVAKQDLADRALDNATMLAVTLTPPSATETPESARPRKYPVATGEQKAAAKSAMRQLAGMCDGARTLDGAGFSRYDVALGHDLAGRTGEYTDGQVFLAGKLVRKYQRQLDDVTLAALGIERKK